MKLWLPELSANILVFFKLCPASDCPVVTCLSYKLRRTPFLLTSTQCLCKISFGNLKHFFKIFTWKYPILAKQTVRGERGKILKIIHHTPSITYTAYRPQIYTLIGVMCLYVKKKYYSYRPQNFRSIRRI